MSEREFSDSVGLKEISWMVGLQGNRLDGHEDIQISRRELQEILPQTTAFCIETIVKKYSLSGQVEDAMYQKLSEFDTRLVDGGSSEIPIDDSESMPIGSIVARLGNVALLPSIDPESLVKPRAQDIIYLSVSAIAEEYVALEKAANSSLANKGTHGVNAKTLEFITNLSEDPEKLKSIAIAMTFARRLLKYGLLRDEDMPKEYRETFGFSEWLKRCHEKLTRKAPFNRTDKEILKTRFIEDNFAVKNLRYTVWADIFYSLVGVEPENDPSFYLHYAQTIDEGNYSITFNYNHLAALVSNSKVKKCLSSIYTPQNFKLRSVSDTES